jgi:enoyl-CoA hydratase
VRHDLRIALGTSPVSSPDAVTSSRSGPVTTITLHRPEVRNAVDGPTARALADAFRAFDGDPEASVAILYGAGGTFCAGADLKAMSGDRANRVAPDGDGPMGPTRLVLSKPVIAAVEGYAVAGGLELALWCDLRVAARDATFGVFCRRWGVPLIDGGTVRLGRLIGTSHAMDLILTGRPVSAEEAHRIGLANRLAEPGGAVAAATELALSLAAFPQVCLRQDRLSLLEANGLDEPTAIANELQHGLVAMRAGETRAGAQRFAAGAGRHGQLEIEAEAGLTE